MQYIPCNSALLAQETLFLTQKGTFFAQRSPKSALIATNLNSRQNSVCSGLKFSSESKLFGGCHPCSRATSATLLPSMTFSLNTFERLIWLCFLRCVHCFLRCFHSVSSLTLELCFLFSFSLFSFTAQN